jgi:UDP-glucose 4-epimerase
MKVMITGASTPLGLGIIERLTSSPEVTFVLAVAHGPRPERLVESARLRYRSVDLTRARGVHDLLWCDARQFGIQAVVHTAQHRRAADRGAKVHAQNVDATRQLLLGCTDHPSISRFVQRSYADVYALGQTTTNLIGEDDPLDFDATPQWLRDRVEADLTACSHFGGRLKIAVLRCAELLAPDSGSQLWDYLMSRVCLRPLGFDPMINVLSLEDAADACVAAVCSGQGGVFNIPGADTLPLSAAIAESSRADVPIPGPLMAPLYGLRRWIAGFDFRYDLNLRRFHFGGILSGSRARDAFGYAPHVHGRWPGPWWRQLVEQLRSGRATPA